MGHLSHGGCLFTMILFMLLEQLSLAGPLVHRSYLTRKEACSALTQVAICLAKCQCSRLPTAEGQCISSPAGQDMLSSVLDPRRCWPGAIRGCDPNCLSRRHSPFLQLFAASTDQCLLWPALMAIAALQRDRSSWLWAADTSAIQPYHHSYVSRSMTLLCTWMADR